MNKITRRELFRLAGGAVVGKILIGCGTTAKEQAIHIISNEPVITPQGRILPPDARRA